MTHPPHHPLRLTFLILGVLLSWGFSWPIMKLVIQHVPPLWMATTRLGIGAIALFIFLLISKRKLLPTKADLPLLISVGFFLMGVFTLLISLGLARVDAGRSAILVYTTPLWVVPIATIFFKEPLHKFTLFGMILGILGVIWLFNPFTFNWSDHNALLGNGLLLLAALIWAMVILHIRFSRNKRSPLELAPWQALIATILLATTAYLDQPHPDLQWSWPLIAQFAYLGLIASGFAYWGAIEMNRQLPAITTSLLLLAVPMIGLLSSAAILGEKITLSITIAVLLIFSGLVCVALSKRAMSKNTLSVTPIPNEVG